MVVEDYMSVLRYSHVMHIGSTVRGTIRPDKDAVDAVDAILPAGTLSGAPKIPGLPDHPRNWRDRNGAFTAEPSDIWISAEISIPVSPSVSPIRKTAACVVQSGAGIVADSIPENEFTGVLQQSPGCGSCT